ncbi:MAG: cupin domain-containing protein [Chloroflexi bacterium]|nr:cupin domain-containing protein [Chloroflexota bacterium]
MAKPNYHRSFDDIERSDLVPGVTARPMWGEKIMMSIIEISPNAIVPEHAHPHEQAGMVIYGEFEFTIGGVAKTIKQGDAYIIPGNVPHALVNGPGLSVALDLFSPPREGYQKAEAKLEDKFIVKKGAKKPAVKKPAAGKKTTTRRAKN